MSRRTPPPRPDLAALVPSWIVALQAERKSPSTITTYRKGAADFLRWATETGTPAIIDRTTVTAYSAALLADGREPATVRARQTALRNLSRWLADEGEAEHDALLGLRPPKLDAKVVQPLSEGQVRDLIRACAGASFLDRRDEALIRLMLETGCRAGEAVALTVADVDVVRGTALIRRGKGGKGRVVPFGPQTARALDRYKRKRASHRLAASDALWLGDRGKTFSYSGLNLALSSRARAAGIDGFHPHLLRHTAAHRWLAAGGSEGGLMAVAGWSSPDMLTRYTRARASDRAAAEARALGLGDL